MCGAKGRDENNLWNNDKVDTNECVFSKMLRLGASMNEPKIE